MHYLTRRSLQRVAPRVRLYSDNAAPRVTPLPASQPSETVSRVASSIDGISIPHKDEIIQRRTTAPYTPNISYLQGGATSKSSLAARLANRASNAPVTSSILDKAKPKRASPPNTASPPMSGKAPKARAQVVVAPRKEGDSGQNGAQPRFDAKRKPVFNAAMGARTPNRANSGPFKGQGNGSFSNRPLPPRPFPPGRAQFPPRQPSAQNASSRGKNAPKKKSRRQVQAEEKEAGESLRIIDQLPPDMSFTPDFTPSDWKSLVSSSSELRRPRTVFEHSGGDYSRFGPRTVISPQDVKTNTVNIAEITLAQQKDVGLLQRVKTVDMIKKSVGLQVAKNA